MGRRSVSVDEVITKYFKGENLKTICDSFMTAFIEGVTNAIHTYDIRTIDTLASKTPNSIYLEEAREEEVLSIIQKLKVKKGLGLERSRPRPSLDHA